MSDKQKGFRFAVMGAGYISGKFCDAVKRVEGCNVAAVASKSMERALAFGEKNGVERAYDSYEKMLERERPDCVYIGATTDAHYELSKLCIEHNVPVLCEKPMFGNSGQAEEIFSLAEGKRVFAMEAMWSRFLPAVKKAKDWLDKGEIGAPVYGEIALGFRAPENPANRYYSPKLGGGAAYDLMVYCYELADFLLGRPEAAEAVSAVFGKTGVDLTDHLLLRFTADGVCQVLPGEENQEDLCGCPRILVSCMATLAAPVEEKLILYGKKGKIHIPIPHMAKEAFLYDEKGKCREHFRDEMTENGFIYEVEEAVRCIRAGRIESETVPHSLTLECAQIFDRLFENRDHGTGL